VLTTHGIVIQELAHDAEFLSDVGTELEKSRQSTFKYTPEPLQEVRLSTKVEPDVTPPSFTTYDMTDNTVNR